MVDSGMVVVVFIISSLIIITFSFLLFVDYEWCHVLFKNNTVLLLLSNFIPRPRPNMEKELTMFSSFQNNNKT